MILFVNKVKIKWEYNNCIERKMKKKNESQFLANKISNGENRKKTILKNKKEIDLSLFEPTHQIYNLVVRLGSPREKKIE